MTPRNDYENLTSLAFDEDDCGLASPAAAFACRGRLRHSKIGDFPQLMSSACDSWDN